MSGQVLTYDPRQLALTVGGFIISGFAEDEFVKVARDDDAFFKHVGVTGEVARVQNFNQSGTVTVVLMQSSASNDDLSALAAVDFASRGLAGAVPVTCRDRSGRSVFASVFSWVKKFPDSTYGRDATTREWVIECANLLISMGGN